MALRRESGIPLYMHSTYSYPVRPYSTYDTIAFLCCERLRSSAHTRTLSELVRSPAIADPIWSSIFLLRRLQRLETAMQFVRSVRVMDFQVVSEEGSLLPRGSKHWREAEESFDLHSAMALIHLTLQVFGPTGFDH